MTPEERIADMIAAGMPPDLAREIVAVVYGGGDVILRDERGRRIPTPDLSTEVVEGWGRLGS